MRFPASFLSRRRRREPPPSGELPARNRHGLKALEVLSVDLGLLKSECEPRVVDLDLKFPANFFFFFSLFFCLCF